MYFANFFCNLYVKEEKHMASVKCVTRYVLFLLVIQITKKFGKIHVIYTQIITAVADFPPSSTVSLDSSLNVEPTSSPCLSSSYWKRIDNGR